MSSHFDLRLIYASDLEEALEDQQTINFAAIVDALDDGSMATLKLSAGDNYIPGPFFNAGGIRSVFRDDDVLNDAYNGLFGLSGADSYDSLREQPGVVDISIMNMIGFDASVVGNHEFDAGPSAFEDLVAADARGAAGPAGDRYVGALFPYLSSNLDFSGESGLQALYTDDIVDASAGAPNTLAPAAFFDLDNGAGGTERVAVVGVTTPVLPAITSPGNVQVSGTAGLNRYPTTDAEYEAVTDALALEVQPVINQALANGANKVVLVSHLQQYEMESRLAPKLAGIDVVIAGGSGTEATTAADGIELTNADGDPVFVVSQNGQYSSVGELTLRFDSNGVPSLANAREIQSDAAGVASVGGDVTTGSAALVGDLVAAVRDIVYTNDQDIRGYTDVYLQGNRGSIRTEETNFGNLAADSQLWYARQQDSTIQVSLKNGGGLRAPIGTIGGTAQNPTLEAPEALVAANDGYDKPAGGISQLDLQNTLRFNNNLVRVDTDAAGLRTLMEHSVNGSSPTATPGQFPQVSGMRFSFNYQQDFSEDAGQQRLQSLVLVDDADEITDVIVRDGDLVGDPNRSVSMVTLGFLANNDGDSYPFSQVAHSITDITDVNGDRIYEQDALSDYLGTFHATPETAYNIAETTADQDQRIINIGTGNTNNIELAIDSGVAAADQPMATLDIGSPAEIGAYSTEHRVALATTGGDELALIDLSDLSAPASLGTIQLSGDLQSVAVSGDLVAVAVDGGGDNVAGEVQFLSLSGVGDAATLTDEGSVTVGALPDSLAFNADGSKLVVANEAQSIDITDPVNNDAEGTISVIDTSSYSAGDISGFSVDTIDFTALNGQEAQLNAEGIRINPNAGSVAQDIEPEYVTVLGDRAWVSLQENNAIAEIDLTDNSLTDIWSLGLKDWSAIATDTSNRDEAGGAYGTKNLYGIKMPDGIDAFQTGGGTYIITANEGDDRDGDGDLNEAVRVADLSDDFGASTANQAYWQSQLGDRLKLSTTEGDLDGDGDIDVAHAFGGRSFSIYDDAGHLVFDSGNQLDEIANAAGIYDDGRSDDKGMEPEMVLTQAINDSVYAFVALERADHSAIAMYDVTVPEHSTFVQLFTNTADTNSSTDTVADAWGPEGLVFIPTEASGAGVLMATNEGDDYAEEGQIDFYSVLETNRPGAPASGNNDLEVAYAFGGRSFSIYDDAGNLVFDSGNQLDEIAKAAGIYDDGRSDDKGMEPEMVLTQAINDSVYAFVALERADHSAIAMYDVTEPEHSRFIQLLTNTAETTNSSNDTVADAWGPEGLVFIQTQNNGAGVLMATNEGDDYDEEGQIDLYSVMSSLDPLTSVSMNDHAEQLGGMPFIPNGRVNIDANGFSLGSQDVVLTNSSDMSYLYGLEDGSNVLLQDTYGVFVIDPHGSVEIGVGHEGYLKLSDAVDNVYNLGHRGSTIDAGTGADLFEVNADQHGVYGPDLIRDFQVGIDEIIVNTESGQVSFGADAEVDDLRSNPLLSGLSFRFTPDLRTASGALNVISEQTSVFGAGLRVARTDSDIVAAEVMVHGGSRLMLDRSLLPAGVEATVQADGSGISFQAVSGSHHLEAAALHDALRAVQFKGSMAGSVEVRATDANGLVATSTEREFNFVAPHAASALRPQVMQLSENAFGADIAFSAPLKHGMTVLGGAADDTVTTAGAETGRNTLFGFGGNDVLSGPGRQEGGAGDDVLIGHRQFANLIGGSGNDRLIGDTGNFLAGGNGDDTLMASGGRNIMQGGAGSDRFVLLHRDADLSAGANVITDYEAGVDQLIFGDGTDAQSATFHTTSSGDTQVMLGADHLATLLGVSSEQITNADLGDQGSGISSIDDIVSGAQSQHPLPSSPSAY